MSELLHEFLDLELHRNGAARGAPALQPVDALFDAPDEGGVPDALRLSRDAAGWLDAVLPDLKPDDEDIQACVLREDGENVAAKRAEANFDAEPCRAAKRCAAVAAIVDLDRWLADGDRVLAREIELRDAKPRTAELLYLREGIRPGPAAVAKALPLLLYGSTFVLGGAAELLNAVSLLDSSGFELPGGWLGKLAFVLPVVAAPFTGLKFLDHNLSPDGRKRLKSFLSRVGVPLCVATIGVFAFTIGRLHEHVDAFGGGGSWAPPLWLLFLASMLSLAVMVTMAPTLIAHAAGEFFERRPTPNPAYVEADIRVTQLLAAIRGTRETRGRLLAVIERLDAERRMFADRCVARLARQRKARAAKRAQLDADRPTS